MPKQYSRLHKGEVTLRLGCNLANGKVGGDSKIGCVLGLDFKHLDGASFMSNGDCYGHLCTNHGSKWQLDGRYFNGSSDYLQVASHPAFNIGTGDLTAVSPISVSKAKQGTEFDWWGGNAGNLVFHKSVADEYHYSDGTDWPKWGASARFDWWDCLALLRRVGVFQSFVDGNPVGTSTYNWNINFQANALLIGRADGFTRYFQGLVGRQLFFNFADYAPRIVERAIEGG